MARPLIVSAAFLPADGMIAVRAWDRLRARGWHLEGTPDEIGVVVATPVSISTGETNGEPRQIHLRFGLDRITAVP
jgi:hypothetical protein